MITDKQLGYLVALLIKRDVVGWAGAQRYMAERGVSVERFEDLTSLQASRLIASLEGKPAAAPGGKDDPW